MIRMAEMIRIEVYVKAKEEESRQRVKAGNDKEQLKHCIGLAEQVARGIWKNKTGKTKKQVLHIIKQTTRPNCCFLIKLVIKEEVFDLYFSTFHTQQTFVNARKVLHAFLLLKV